MSDRLKWLLGALLVILFATALLGGFDTTEGRLGMGFVLLAVVGVGARGFVQTRSLSPAPAPGPTAEPDPGETIDHLRRVIPAQVEPPPSGVYVGVCVGLQRDDGRGLVPLIPAGTQLPARAKTSVSTQRGDQQRLDIPLVTSLGKEAGPLAALTTVTIRGIAPAPAGVPRLTLYVMVDPGGGLAVKAMDSKTRVELSADAAGAVTVPIARAVPTAG